MTAVSTIPAGARALEAEQGTAAELPCLAHPALSRSCSTFEDKSVEVLVASARFVLTQQQRAGSSLQSCQLSISCSANLVIFDKAKQSVGRQLSLKAIKL